MRLTRDILKDYRATRHSGGKTIEKPMKPGDLLAFLKREAPRAPGDCSQSLRYEPFLN